MRNQDYLPSPLVAPATLVAVAKLKKVNRPVKGVYPTLVDDAPTRVVDLNNRTRPKLRYHHTVFKPDVTVPILFHIQPGE
jgi:hypothetical protein